MAVNRRRVSRANSVVLRAASACSTASLMPTFRMVSIMPGMDWVAPERTLTSSGRGPRPNVREVLPSSQFNCGQHVVPDGVDRRRGFGEIPQTHLGGDAEGGRHRQIVPAHRVDAVALVAQNLPRQIRVAVQQHHGLVFGGAFEGACASCETSRGAPPPGSAAGRADAERPLCFHTGRPDTPACRCCYPIDPDDLGLQL